MSPKKPHLPEEERRKRRHVGLSDCELETLEAGARHVLLVRSRFTREAALAVAHWLLDGHLEGAPDWLRFHCGDKLARALRESGVPPEVRQVVLARLGVEP